LLRASILRVKVEAAINASTLTLRIDALNKALNNLTMAKNDIVAP
jgi:hypothetical protein